MCIRDSVTHSELEEGHQAQQQVFNTHSKLEGGPRAQQERKDSANGWESSMGPQNCTGKTIGVPKPRTPKFPDLKAPKIKLKRKYVKKKIFETGVENNKVKKLVGFWEALKPKPKKDETIKKEILEKIESKAKFDEE